MKMLVHEKAHSLNRGEEIPQTKQLETYGSMDPEDYNVLQEIRWRFGIKPNATLNDSDIQLLKQHIQNENDLYFTEFLNRFSGKLKEVFNLVADSGQRQTNPISFAQQGIKLLTLHKDYLGIPYKQDGDYNYYAAHPTNIPTKSGEH